MMNNKKYVKPLILLSAIGVSVLLIILFHLLFAQIPPVTECRDIIEQRSVKFNSETKQTEDILTVYDFNEKIAAVRISDLAELGIITRINYTPDVFVEPGTLDPSSRIVDLTDKTFGFAGRGTIQIIILNLNPDAEDFNLQSEALAPQKIGDYWHYTLAIPQIFSACNIYQKLQCVSCLGEISEYNYSDYNTNFKKETDTHHNKTEYTYLDLTFYPKREAMALPLQAAQIITIHYESENNLAGMSAFPLIGEDDNVRGVTDTNTRRLTVAAAIAALILAVFAFICTLKRTTFFIPQLLISAGTFAIFLSNAALCGTTEHPFFWLALEPAALLLMLAAAVFAASNNIGKIPVRYILTGIVTAAIPLCFSIPFVSAATENIFGIIIIIIKAIGAASITAFAFWRAFRKNDDLWLLITPLLVAVTVASTLFLEKPQFAIHDPLFLMLVVMTAISFAVSCRVFVTLERRNRYLTDNLNSEILIQTAALKNLVQERDNLLRFLSHDLKKPLLSVNGYLDTLLSRISEPESHKLINLIKQKNSESIRNLSEVSKYSKYNYLSELSGTVRIDELCDRIYQNIEPDCSANGIVLTNNAHGALTVFAKPNGLESALMNIIINAIEHANCTRITLHMAKIRNKCMITIKDNGKGIDSAIDVFKPYVSENDNGEANGLGLYICREIIASMNGTLTYTCENNETSFIITLPLA